MRLTYKLKSLTASALENKLTPGEIPMVLKLCHQALYQRLHI